MTEPDKVAVIEKETGQRCGNRKLTAANRLREHVVSAREHGWSGLAVNLEALADDLDGKVKTK